MEREQRPLDDVMNRRASGAQRLAAAVLALVLTVSTVLSILFAEHPFPNIPAVLPAVMVMCTLCEALTAFLLSVHYKLRPTPMLAGLIGVYVFDALMAAAY